MITCKYLNAMFEVVDEELGLILDRVTDEPYERLFTEWEKQFPEAVRAEKGIWLYNTLWEILRPYKEIAYFTGLKHGVSLGGAFAGDVVEQLYSDKKNHADA